MARPRKQTVDYFPHMCTHGKTMFIIEQKYGNDGYAFWFKLLEMLGSAEGHYLHLENGPDWEFLQAKTHIEADKCEELLDLLAKLDAIDSELWEQKVVWSDKFITNVSDAYRNRKVEIPNKPSFLRKKPTEEEQSDAINPQMKLNEIKEDDISFCPKSPTYDEQDIRYQLSLRLHQLVKTNNPKAKEPNLQRWADDVRLMMERDKRTEEEIKTVIDWCQQDSFWKSNILSTRKLREKFDQLYVKMTTGKGNVKNGTYEQSKSILQKYRTGGQVI